jgi:hypothetical protein
VFYYYGSKHRLARLYPKPIHNVVVEPFAGAAGYGIYHLVRHNIERVVLVEKDPRVCTLWRRILSMTPADLRALTIPRPGEVTHDFLFMTAATSNGIARSHKMTVTERQPKEIRRMLRRIGLLLPVVRDRIVLIEGDYQDAPEIEATWFVDPPYQVRPVAPGNPKTGSPQGMGYAAGCDAASLDYDALADWCRTRKGQVIAVEQSSATWLPFSFQALSQDSSGSLKTEVVWHSHAEPAPVQLGFL